MPISAFRPNIPRAYGSAKDVASRAIAQVGTPKSIAERLGRRASVVHAYTDPNHTTHIPYDKVRRLTEEGATAFVEDLCALAGGAFTPGAPSNEALQALAGKSTVEISLFVAELLTALEDKTICAKEQAILLERIDAGLRHLIQCRVQVARALEDA